MRKRIRFWLRGAVLRKLGTECNRTADSRMVLTDGQDSSLHRETYKSLQRHGLGDPGFSSIVRQMDFVVCQ